MDCSYTQWIAREYAGRPYTCKGFTPIGNPLCQCTVHCGLHPSLPRPSLASLTLASKSRALFTRLLTCILGVRSTPFICVASPCAMLAACRAHGPDRLRARVMWTGRPRVDHQRCTIESCDLRVACACRRPSNECPGCGTLASCISSRLAVGVLTGLTPDLSCMRSILPPTFGMHSVLPVSLAYGLVCGALACALWSDLPCSPARSSP